jgi:hypothetical protein
MSPAKRTVLALLIVAALCPGARSEDRPAATFQRRFPRLLIPPQG